MWINLGKELINTNAVSEIILRKVNDEYKIEFYRTDGSFMTSIRYESEIEAETDLDNIKGVIGI